VSSGSEQSNFHQSRPLLDSLALPPESVLRVRTELSAEEAAADYDRALRGLVGGGTSVGFGLLGLGADGHTASLFTATDLERSRGRWAVAVQRPDGMAGISVTPEFLAQVGELVFVVAGAGKREALSRLVLQDPALVAWAAVRGCRAVQLWMESGAE
jgi:6-phosphogluconolactonase